MLLYPQLLSGAVAQFPLRRTYAVSNIANVQEDGSKYLSSATDLPLVAWHLLYQTLTKQEADSLQQFFQTARGRLRPFLFLDPTQNLLAWSTDLLNPSWEVTPYITVSAIESDFEDSFAVAVQSSGGGKLTQSVPVPATALVCFSLYARSAQPGVLVIAVGDQSNRVQRSFAIGTAWQLLSVTQSGSGDGLDKQVEVFVASGSGVSVAQLCLAPQPAPGGYTATLSSTGAMLQTRFDQDTLTITANSTETFSCAVNLLVRLD